MSTSKLTDKNITQVLHKRGYLYGSYQLSGSL